MGATIRSIQAREVFARRTVLTLEVTVTTDDGAEGVSAPEAGISVGSHEAAFLKDGGERYNGLGMRKAVEAVNKEIGPALHGMSVTDQAGIDRAMIELDGTPNKARLGANAIVAVSLAAARAAAKSAGVPLYRYIGGVNGCTIPIPIVGIGTGGRYRDAGQTRQFKPSYEFAAYGAGSYAEAQHYSWRCVEEMKRLLRARYHDTYSPARNANTLAGVVSHDREVLELMTESIVRCGYEGKIGIYFDVASDAYYEPDIDKYVGLFSPGEKSREDVIALLKDFVEHFPVVSLEDPCREDDYEGVAMATKELGIEVVGDDLFTTNFERLKRGIEAGAANSMVLKIPQVGTVSEALAACRLAQANGYNVHPCGSRGDIDTIGDFAVGLNAGQCRGGDRNRILAIEEELGESAVWLGKAAYKGWRNQRAG